MSPGRPHALESRPVRPRDRRAARTPSPEPTAVAFRGVYGMSDEDQVNFRRLTFNPQELTNGPASQNPAERRRDLLGQSRSPGRHQRLRRTLRGPHMATAAALDLAEPADEIGGTAVRATIEVGLPVMGTLAYRADQHLPFALDSALPCARAANRIGLPSPAPIAGHGGPFQELPAAGPLFEQRPGSQVTTKSRRAPCGTRRCRGRPVSR